VNKIRNPKVGQFWTPIVGQFWMPIDNQDKNLLLAVGKANGRNDDQGQKII